jgi:hypothetical protein
LECFGLTELWMGIERVDGKIQSGVKPPQSKKPGSGTSREGAKARKVGDRVSKLPKTFCCHVGVLECSGWTELWMGIERVDGKIQSGVQPPQSKKPGSGLNFLIQISGFRIPPQPSTLDSRLSTQSPDLRVTPTVGLRITMRCLRVARRGFQIKPYLSRV